MMDHPMQFETENPEWDENNPDDPRQPKMLQWLKIPVTKASTAKEPEYVDLCISRLKDTDYLELIFRGAKGVVNLGASKVPGDKSSASRKAAVEKAQEQVEKIYSGKIRITGGRAKTGDSQEVQVLARQKAIKRLKSQAKRQGKKISLIAASKWTALAKKLLETTKQGEEIYAEARAEVAAYEKEVVGVDLSDLKEDEQLVRKAIERKSAKKKASDDADELLAGVVSQMSKRPTQTVVKH